MEMPWFWVGNPRDAEAIAAMEANKAPARLIVDQKISNLRQILAVKEPSAPDENVKISQKKRALRSSSLQRLDPSNEGTTRRKQPRSVAITKQFTALYLPRSRNRIPCALN